MKSEFVITNGEKFIRCDIDGRYKQVKNLSLAEIYEDKKTALNIVKNSLPKKLAYKYYVAQVVDGEILQNTMPKPPTAKTSKTEAVYDFKTDMSQTEWYEGFMGLDGVFSEAIKRSKTLAQEISDVDCKLVDLAHYIEFSQLNAREGYMAYKKLREFLLIRRNLKDEQTVVNAINTRCNVAKEVNEIIDIIVQCENQQYKPRILPELFTDGIKAII